jgi:hypothetical protein
MSAKSEMQRTSQASGLAPEGIGVIVPTLAF